MSDTNKIKKINIDGVDYHLMDEETYKKTLYTNATPTPSALGGIAKGTTFNEKPISEVLNSLLYPYVSFSASMSTSPSGSVYEIGTSVNVTSATINITLGSASITSIVVKDSANTTLGSKTSGITSGGNTISISKSISSNETLKAIVTDSTGASKTISSSSFTFVNPYYYGAISSDATLSESLIKGLTKNVTTRGNKTYTITMNQQKGVIAYPSSYGALTKILDENSFNVTDTFIQNTLTINGVSYYVYVLNNPVTSTMKYTFSY